MAKSQRYKVLAQETEILRKQFLPNPFDPLGQYPDPPQVQASTRAFLVLVHAELESYLEGWAKDIARAAEAVWTTSRRVTPPLAYLLATLAERLEIPTTLVGPNAKDPAQRMGDASKRLFQKYYKSVRDNHGIKEKNFLALFAPLGVEAAALSATLLPDLDAVGSLRGTHAHESARAVTSVLDPETEYHRVSQLLKELEILDAWLVAYRRRIR